jgi:phage internal scaffolding protein
MSFVYVWWLCFSFFLGSNFSGGDMSRSVPVSRVAVVVPEFRTAYSSPYRGDDVFFPEDAVGAQQSFAAECDVNQIIKRFSVSGEFTHLNLRSPIFGDVRGLDFQGMLDYIAHAESAFMDLPADVRKRFDNNPRDFVEFCSDPKNVDEMVKLGLVVKEEDKVVLPVVGSKTESAPAVGSVKP